MYELLLVCFGEHANNLKSFLRPNRVERERNKERDKDIQQEEERQSTQDFFLFCFVLAWLTPY